MKQWIGHTSNNQKALLLSQIKFLFHSKQVAFPPFQINKLFSHKAKPSVLMWWNGKFEFGKELYKVEKRKIVRGIILAILLICTVFLVYSIVSNPLGEHDTILALAVTAGFIALGQNKR